MSMQPPSKAVFPIAGLGSRFLPATKAAPKEMLPIVDKPLIQYAVEEAYAAGIRQMIFVTGRTKRAIEDHFDTAYELETELEAAGKHELLTLIRGIKPEDMTCVYVRQPRALGLGHAILCAQPLIGQEAFTVLLADDLMIGEPPVLSQLMELHKELGTSVLAVEPVPAQDTGRYGIIAGVEIRDRLWQLDGIVEKPLPSEAPSRLGVAGRYVLTPAIFNCIRAQPRGVGGEIQLTDGIAALRQFEPVHAWQYGGTRYDCGSKLGFLKATVELGMHHPECGAMFADWLMTRDQR
jgi:UTP--glucose-1-phosphate uridylyltransferase